MYIINNAKQEIIV